MGRGRGQSAAKARPPAPARRAADDYSNQLAACLESNRQAARSLILTAFGDVRDPGGDLHELFEALSSSREGDHLEFFLAAARGVVGQIPPRELPIDQMIRHLTLLCEKEAGQDPGNQRRQVLDGYREILFRCAAQGSLTPLLGSEPVWGVSGSASGQAMRGAFVPVVYRRITGLLDAGDHQGVRDSMAELWELWGDYKRAEAHRQMSDETIDRTRRWLAAAAILYESEPDREQPAFDLLADMPLMDQDALDLLAVPRLAGARRNRAFYRHGAHAQSFRSSPPAGSADAFESDLISIFRMPEAWKITESGPGAQCFSVPVDGPALKEITERFAGTPIEGRVRMIDMSVRNRQGAIRRRCALAYTIEAVHDGEPLTVQAVYELGGESSAATSQGVRNFYGPVLSRLGYPDPSGQLSLIENAVRLEGPLEMRERGTLGTRKPARALPSLGLRDECSHARARRESWGDPFDLATACLSCNQHHLAVIAGHRFPPESLEGQGFQRALSMAAGGCGTYVRSETAYSIALGLPTPPVGASDEEALSFFRNRDGLVSDDPRDDISALRKRRAPATSVAAAMNRR